MSHKKATRQLCRFGQAEPNKQVKEFTVMQRRKSQITD